MSKDVRFSGKMYHTIRRNEGFRGCGLSIAKTTALSPAMISTSPVFKSQKVIIPHLPEYTAPSAGVWRINLVHPGTPLIWSDHLFTVPRFPTRIRQILSRNLGVDHSRGHGLTLMRQWISRLIGIRTDPYHQRSIVHVHEVGRRL